jgi:hypothetical protein
MGEEHVMATSIKPAQLIAFLGPQAEERVRRYFTSGDFTGAQFERFAGGGDAFAVRDRFTADDLVAVSMLSVDLPGRATSEIIERDDEVRVALTQVPPYVPLWEADDDIVGPDSPASRVWSALERIDGVDWSAAHKLLARKRPHLLPVYDDVIANALDRGDEDGWWLPLRDVLRGNPAIRERLLRIRELSGVGNDISELRILDVAIRMKATD